MHGGDLTWARCPSARSAHRVRRRALRPTRSLAARAICCTGHASHRSCGAKRQRPPFPSPTQVPLKLWLRKEFDIRVSTEAPANARTSEAGARMAEAHGAHRFVAPAVLRAASRLPGKRDKEGFARMQGDGEEL